MVSGSPDFWLRGTYIGLIDRIKLIDQLDRIDRIMLIDEISKVTNIDKISVIEGLKQLDRISEISNIQKISSIGETGTLTYFSEAATADILTPTADYRTRVLGAVVYNPTDIQAYLRWKNTGNFILGVPTIGLVGMNPMGLKHSLGAADEVLELYMSAAGAVKGWVVTEEQYSVGTPHAKTITELLGLVDTKDATRIGAGGLIFGYQIKSPALDPYPADKIYGTYFTCPNAGTADSITLYMKQYSSYTPKTRCAIYRRSDGVLIGYTEEWTLTSGFDDWHTFNMEWGGALEADVEYFLCFWQDAKCSQSSKHVADSSAYKTLPYDSFPNPIAWDDITWLYLSIYCTYHT